MASSMLNEKQKKIFIRQHYGLAGKHSAVKVCGWTRKSLHDKGVCYKQKFYGIPCHRCLQFTPTVNSCTQNCKFCWRLGSYNYDDNLNDWDKPKEIVDKSIEAQRRLLSGFPGSTCNIEKWKEAQKPKQVAISLAGEPTIYPKLGKLIEEFHKLSMSTFLVTNGTLPKSLKNLKTLPTQMYVTLASPDSKTFEKLCQPNIPNAWENLKKTLSIFQNLNTRKVIRLTLVKGHNMHSIENYAKLIKKANPDFVEVKAFMSVGGARKRLEYEAMPFHEEIVDFAKELGDNLKIKFAEEQKESRVALLTNKNKKEWNIHS